MLSPCLYSRLYVSFSTWFLSCGFALVLAFGLGAPVWGMSDAELAAIVAQRISGDRTGANLAVALVDGDEVARAFVSADPRTAQARVDARSAFEIGSVTKTMTAALLADLIQRGEVSLDDSLGAWLPEGTAVPDFEGQPILLRHIITHTSGLPELPSRMQNANPNSPYAKLSERELLDSLADVVLRAAPDTHYAYSNFGFMLLSYALARRADSHGLETLLRERLFVPLGMSGAHVGKRPKAVRAATGHTSHDAKPTPAWQFPPRLSGVGGVRATLDDMLCYLQAHLAAAAGPLASPGEERVTGRSAALSALRLSQERLHGSPALAMAWMQGQLGRERLLFHGGTTGGFSAHIAFLPEPGRGVVLLSDTSWGSIGGLENLALHLLDSRVPLDQPRQRVEPAPELLTALEGRYQLHGAMPFVLYQRRGALYIHP